jgi:hypothetical protein
MIIKTKKLWDKKNYEKNTSQNIWLLQILKKSVQNRPAHECVSAVNQR